MVLCLYSFQVSDIATKWKELQCTQEDVAVRFLKQSPQTVKVQDVINTVIKDSVTEQGTFS